MKYWALVFVFLAGCAVERTKQPGEEFKLGGTLTCCDCGLVHNVTCRVDGNDVYVRMWRNKWLTAERREHLRDVNE